MNIKVERDVCEGNLDESVCRIHVPWDQLVNHDVPICPCMSPMKMYLTLHLTGVVAPGKMTCFIMFLLYHFMFIFPTAKGDKFPVYN